MRITASALLLILSATTSHAANPCEIALEAQSSMTGIPSSLAAALSSSLAIGPSGKMYPYAVYVDGKTSIEQNPENAFRLIRSYLSRGANDIRAGCLGVSITNGHDANFIRQTLDPRWNVETSLAGINSNVKQTDIGAPLAAIVNSSAPLTYLETPGLSENELSKYDEPFISDLSVGNERESKAPGSLKSTWGLFNDRKPIPLTKP